MYPANQIIVIVLFPDAAEIGGESAAEHVGSFANRVACQAAARLQQLFAVRRVACGLLRELRAGDPGLPDERGDGLHFVGLQSELRHLGRWPELVRMLQPVRDPFLVNLHPHFF